ncbi:MAG: GH36-type glycosyl hydrolase domain-containing protein [Candidatus Lokiarchaeia archaeon]
MSDYGCGRFGRWIVDEHGLPAYEYTCNHEIDTAALTFTTQGSSRDHWHQLGNSRFNALAHNSGFVEVFENSRGPQWLTYSSVKQRSLGGGIAIVAEDGDCWCDLFSQKRYDEGYRRVFGMGYFRKVSKHNNLVLDHIVLTPVSDDPVVVSEVTVRNKSNRARTIMLFNYWGVNLRYVSESLIYTSGRRTEYGVSVLNWLGRIYGFLRHLLLWDTEQGRTSFSKKFIYHTEYDLESGLLILVPEYRGDKSGREVPSSRNYYPKPLFLKLLNEKPTLAISSAEDLVDNRGNFKILSSRLGVRKLSVKKSPCLCLGVKLTIPRKSSRTLTFLFGYSEKQEIPKLVSKYEEKARRHPLREVLRDWKKSTIKFVGGEDWVSREAAWHSYYFKSSTLCDEYFESHLLPQGGAYVYLQGLHGGPRDFSLYTVPMTYLDPVLAREMLEYVLRWMRPSGELAYSQSGFGKLSGAIVHNKPSDHYLFLLWAITEYVFATRDFKFLEKEVPFYPREKGLFSTVAERMKLSLNFLFEEIGFGEHGLLKVGDGDWNDGISTMVPNRSRFLKHGESVFNSALALYVLPRVMDLFRKRDSKFCKFLLKKFESLRRACLDSWNGRWFYRAWDGGGNPLGGGNLFLEPVPWLLLSKALPEKMAEKLLENVYEILDKPSPFGQYLVYPPLRTFLNYLEKGWDVNGGIWFAMNFLLTWSYGLYDPKKAWNSLLKNSMAHHANLYPNLWYGIWSGPDAYNANYAKRPGETYYHLATPTTDFPVMNLNLHANFLTALIKLCGVEPNAEGLTIAPRLPFQKFSLKTPLLELKMKEYEIEGSYTPLYSGPLCLRVKKPVYWPHQIRCYINDELVKYDLADSMITVGLNIYKKFRFRVVHIAP